MKKLIKILASILVFIILILLAKTWIHPFHSPKDISPISMDEFPITNLQVNRLSRGLQVPTVSNADYSKTNFAPFRDYQNLLRRIYPKIFSSLEFQLVNEYGMIFRWKGTNPELKPVLFIAHHDVVPPGTNEGWDYPAFSGKVIDGKIYGRGALDMKNMLHGILESFEMLLDKGYQPKRDIYLISGHDEEVGGRNGAQKIAEYFQAKKIDFDVVYDEGGIIAKQGSIAGMDNHIAVIGVAEKGFMSVKIKVRGLGGHSSMPPMESAIGKAAKIMIDLETNQFAPRVIPSIQEFLNRVGGSMIFPVRMAIANQWLLKPILLRQFAKAPQTNAITRTTTALTMMKGSDSSNVLAPEVEFVVNFRILPGETTEDVRKHIAKATEGYEVELEEISNSRDPTKISPTDTQGFQALKKTLEEIYPDTIAAPYITIAGTDSNQFQSLSKNFYRFNPVLLDRDSQRSIHNHNEHISIENYARTIHYFKSLIQNYDQ